MPEDTNGDESPGGKNIIETAPSNEIAVTPLEATAIVYSGERLRERRDDIVSQYNNNGSVSRDDLQAFVVVAYATVEEYSAQLIYKYLISDRFASDAFEYFYHAMSQGHREELLKTSGIFGDTIIGHIGNFRWLRHKLVHEPHTTINWEKNDLEPTLDSAIDVIDRLYEALTNEDVIDAIVGEEDAEL